MGFVMMLPGRLWLLAVTVCTASALHLGEGPSRLLGAAMHLEAWSHGDLETPAENAFWVPGGPLSVALQAVLVTLYLTMIGCAPFVHWLAVDGWRPTVQQQWPAMLVVYGSLWTSVYLMTNVLAFVGPAHFEGSRSLTVLEAMYFMSQIITTVGYGDLVPAGSFSRSCVAVFIILSLALMGKVVSDVLVVVSDRMQTYANEAIMHANEASTGAMTLARQQTMLGEEADEAQGPESMWRTFSKKAPLYRPPPLPYKRAALALAFYAAFTVMGIAFFHFYPGEHRPLLTGLYMTTVTLSTVGLGDSIPVTPGGMAFASFWMIFGSASFLWTITCWAEVVLAMQVRKKYNPTEAQKQLTDYLDELGGETFDKFEYLKFAIITSGKMREQDVEALEQNWAQLAQAQQQVPVDTLRRLSVGGIVRFAPWQMEHPAVEH